MEMGDGDVPANVTIYINNLNEKIKIDGSFLVSFLCFEFFSWNLKCLRLLLLKSDFANATRVLGFGGFRGVVVLLGWLAVMLTVLPRCWNIFF